MAENKKSFEEEQSMSNTTVYKTIRRILINQLLDELETRMDFTKEIKLECLKSRLMNQILCEQIYFGKALDLRDVFKLLTEYHGCFLKAMDCFCDHFMEIDPKSTTIIQKYCNLIKKQMKGQDIATIDKVDTFSTVTQHTDEDEVRCFHCDVYRRNWQPGDDPWTEHAHSITECPYFLKENDQQCIDKVAALPQTTSKRRMHSGQTAAKKKRQKQNVEEFQENEPTMWDADGDDASYSISNPRYTEEKARRETYLTWPRLAKNNIEPLVNAGFFYTGDEDIVRCFHCDIGLAESSNDDDPWLEHARQSPDCSYLRDQKDAEYIRDVQEKWSKMYSPQNPLFTEIVSRYETFDSSCPSERVIQSPEQLAAAGFYYTGQEDTVWCHYCDGGLEEWEPTDDPWASSEKDNLDEELLSSPVKEVESVGFCGTDVNWKRRTGLGRIGELHGIVATGKSVVLDSHDVGDMNDEIIHDMTAETSNRDSDSKLDLDQSVNTIGKENKILKEQIHCKICLEEEVYLVFIPCGHLIACRQCGERATDCLQCQEIVKEKLKIRLV